MFEVRLEQPVNPCPLVKHAWIRELVNLTVRNHHKGRIIVKQTKAGLVVVFTTSCNELPLSLYKKVARTTGLPKYTVFSAITFVETQLSLNLEEKLKHRTDCSVSPEVYNNVGTRKSNRSKMP